MQTGKATHITLCASAGPLISTSSTNEYCQLPSRPGRERLGLVFSMGQRVFLIYDGVCNLCIIAVRLLHVFDRYGSVGFLSYQMISGEMKARYDLALGNLQGQLHLVLQDGKVISGASAISEVCRLLFPFGVVCQILGTRPFQKLYASLARRRYRIFGCRGSCFMFENQGA